jgi:hypothetical protein
MNSETDTYTGFNIMDISKHILYGLLKNKLVKCNNHIFLLTPGRIIKNKKSIKMDLYKIISNNHYYIGSDEVSKKHHKLNRIVNCIINECRDSIEEYKTIDELKEKYKKDIQEFEEEFNKNIDELKFKIYFFSKK